MDPGKVQEFPSVVGMQSILTAAQSSHLSDWLSLISTPLDGVRRSAHPGEATVHMWKTYNYKHFLHVGPTAPEPAGEDACIKTKSEHLCLSFSVTDPALTISSYITHEDSIKEI